MPKHAPPGRQGSTPEQQRRELVGMIAFIATVILVLASIVFLLGFLKPARAHGPAMWIQFSPTASWCCTAGDDCLRRDLDFARETASGWVVKSTGQVFKEGDRGFFRTLDSTIWACLADDGTVRCLFVPGSGA